ncbi:MAG: sialidase family protein [Woeseia sp.]
MLRAISCISSLLLLIASYPNGAVANAEAAGFLLETLEVPAAAGSQSPNLAVRDETVVLSWIENTGDAHRLRFSILDGNRWSEPRVVASGDNWFVNWADFPSVVPISGSLWAAHWLVQQPAGGYAYDVHFTVSTDRGVTWVDPVLPHDDGTPTEHGFVTLYPHGGGVGLIWLDGRNMVNISHDESHHGGPADTGMTLRSAVYGDALASRDSSQVDGLVCDCCQTDVAITDKGAVAVYRDRSESETRDIYVSSFRNGSWQPGKAVAQDGWVIGGCPVNGPTIAADGNRVAVAWFTAANDRPHLRIARSDDAGESFAEPVEIADGNTWGRTGIALLPDARLAISYLCKDADSRASVCLRAVSADDILGPIHVISAAQDVPAMSVPQLALANERLIVAWTARVAGKLNVQSAAIGVESLHATE